MAVSIPDPSGTPPEPRSSGRTSAPSQSADHALDGTARESDDTSAETSRDGDKSRRRSRGTSSSGRRDTSTGPGSTAEWITLAISSLIVLSLIGLTSYFYL